MSNNTTTSCAPWYFQINAKMETPVYYVLGSMRFFFGLIGHIICLIAFYKQAKKEPAYLYQIFVTVMETIKILVNTMYYCIIVFCWGWTFHPEFKSNYALMWYTAHLGIPLVNMVATALLLLILSMAADRAFAVLNPFAYKNINHGRHQLIALGICTFLGITASTFDCFRYLNPVLGSDGMYKNPLNPSLVGTVWGNVAVGYRSTLRGLAVIAIAVLNTLVTRAYSIRIRKVAAMKAQTHEERKEKKALKDEVTLALLAGFQCFFISLSTVVVIAYNIATYTMPSFDSCESYLWGPIVDGVVMVAETVDFYVVIIVSKRFRRMITSSIGCFSRVTGTTIQTLSTAGNAQ